MEKDEALTAQDVATILHVSKGMVYELVKRGGLSSYRVGRKLRFTQEDVDTYIASTHDDAQKTPSEIISANALGLHSHATRNDFIICGQDIMLDILSNYLRLNNVSALRSYIGSYDSLISLYLDKVQVATAHMWDSDSDSYNVPYVRRLLPGIPSVVIHLACRMQGFYVTTGNPKNITTWNDLARDDVRIINREKGAGSRILLDENFRVLGINSSSVKGYTNETSSHLTVASAVGNGDADVGIGAERMALQVDNVDFIPIKKEDYDLVVKREIFDSPEFQTLLQIIRSDHFQGEFRNIGGYDISRMGCVVAEL